MLTYFHACVGVRGSGYFERGGRMQDTQARRCASEAIRAEGLWPRRFLQHDRLLQYNRWAVSLVYLFYYFNLLLFSCCAQ